MDINLIFRHILTNTFLKKRCVYPVFAIPWKWTTECFKLISPWHDLWKWDILTHTDFWIDNISLVLISCNTLKMNNINVLKFNCPNLWIEIFENIELLLSTYAQFWNFNVLHKQLFLFTNYKRDISHFLVVPALGRQKNGVTQDVSPHYDTETYNMPPSWHNDVPKSSMAVPPMWLRVRM